MLFLNLKLFIFLILLSLKLIDARKFIKIKFFQKIKIYLVNDEGRLYEYLFSSNSSIRYNPNIRPVEQKSNRMVVHARLGIKRLFEMDENNHRVIIFAVLFKVFFINKKFRVV